MRCYSCWRSATGRRQWRKEDALDLRARTALQSHAACCFVLLRSLRLRRALLCSALVAAVSGGSGRRGGAVCSGTATKRNEAQRLGGKHSAQRDEKQKSRDDFANTRPASQREDNKDS